MKLEDIATISVGQILTRVTDPNSELNYKVLQPRAISEGIIRDEFIDEVFVSKTMDDDKLTKAGDVVIKLSTPYEAAVVDEAHAGLLIPSFCAVIRGRTKVYPDYLCALLNSSYIKGQIMRKIAGTVRAMVKISDLRMVDVPDVSESTMESIGNEYRLSMRKMELLSQMIQVEKEIMDSNVLRVLKEAE